MFLWMVDVLPNVLEVLLPPVLLLAAYLRWRKAQAGNRRDMIRLLLLAVMFGLLDWCLLKALPLLNLSYGDPEVPLVMLWLARLSLLVVWMYLTLPSRAGRTAFIAIHLLLTAGLVYSFYIEPFDLHVTRLELSSPLLRPGQRVRIVQLTDIHVERTTRRERSVAEVVRDLQPDLIVLTGDYLNNSYSYDPRAEQDLRWLIEGLRAPYGIYAVNGSSEKPTRMMELLRGLDVTILNNAFRIVPTRAGDLAVVGISDIDHERDVRALTRVAPGLPPGDFSILLYHNPDLIHTAAAAGMDLYLAGHTHGGQIRVPFYGAVITFSIYGKQYEQGLFEQGGTHLYVSRGLGMEGKKAPRARFLAPPEVVCVDLVGE